MNEISKCCNAHLNVSMALEGSGCYCCSECTSVADAKAVISQEQAYRPSPKPKEVKVICLDCPERKHTEDKINYLQVLGGHCFLCHKATPKECHCIEDANTGKLNITELIPTVCNSSCEEKWSSKNPRNKPEQDKPLIEANHTCTCSEYHWQEEKKDCPVHNRPENEHKALGTNPYLFSTPIPDNYAITNASTFLPAKPRCNACREPFPKSLGSNTPHNCISKPQDWENTFDKITEEIKGFIRKLRDEAETEGYTKGRLKACEQMHKELIEQAYRNGFREGVESKDK